MALTRVVSIKVPDDMAILQSRLTAAAKKSQIPVWEFMSRMLNAWEASSGNGEPWGKWAEWRAVIEGKVQVLEAEIEELKAQGQSDLPVNQVNQDIASSLSQPVSQDDVPVQLNDIEAFEAAYNELERDRHALIWKLRKALNWPKERVDDIIRQLRDEGRYQPVGGAETANMTDEQLQAVFIDENDFKFHAVMRGPAKAAEPMGATEPEPEPEAPATPRRRGRPSTKGKSEQEPEVPATPRRRGRPPTKEKPEQKPTATRQAIKKKVTTSEESPSPTLPELATPEEPPVQATKTKRGPGRQKKSV